MVVNVQADEPEIDPEHIRLVVDLLQRNEWAGMATLATPGDEKTAHDPNQVKMIASGERVHAFTRGPAPWNRDAQAPIARPCGILVCMRIVVMYYWAMRIYRRVI